MTGDPDEVDFEAARDAMALFLATVTDDDETVSLILSVADPYRMVQWLMTALRVWILQAGHDPEDFARRTIAATIREAAAGQ